MAPLQPRMKAQCGTPPKSSEETLEKAAMCMFACMGTLPGEQCEITICMHGVWVYEYVLCGVYESVHVCVESVWNTHLSAARRCGCKNL